MKILQLSTGHLGGAGLAARRLNDALVQAGIDSTFVALDSRSFLPTANEISVARSLSKKLTGGLLASAQRHFSGKTLFSPYSISSISIKDLMSFGKPSETILHIHNFQNLVSEKSIRNFSKAGYRIVLTLHDQRYFTGGCHYSFDCKQFQNGCNKCPLVSKMIRSIPKRKLQSNQVREILSERLAVIAPSSWLNSLADDSLILAKFKKYKIDNLLGPEWMSSVQNFKRIRNSGGIVGVASMDPKAYVKGGDIVQDMVASSHSVPIEFIFLRDIPEERRVEDFWSRIDCLLVASRADNSPNVIHEAKSLGIPIIASNVGGIPEILDDHDVCMSLEKMNIKSVLLALDKFRSTENRTLFGIDNFDRLIDHETKNLNKYINVYHDLLSTET